MGPFGRQMVVRLIRSTCSAYVKMSVGQGRLQVGAQNAPFPQHPLQLCRGGCWDRATVLAILNGLTKLDQKVDGTR